MTFPTSAYGYKNIQFDAECAIELSTACNYRCVYCSGPRIKKAVRRGRNEADINCVIQFFNESGKTWLIGMSGGEPTIHPGFEHLITTLKDQHFFYFFSNLTFDVTKFSSLVPAERVSYIKTSLHPEANPDIFLEKFNRLFDANYNPILVMVSLPDRLQNFEKIIAICQSKGWPYTLSVLEGPYNNKNYPNDFSDAEFEFIEKHTHEPGSLIRLYSRTPGGMNTFGLTCRAGHKSFVLDMESGEFLTCESIHSSHGNIYRGGFNPLTGPISCTSINGCVGYDRSTCLPEQYQGFFSNNQGWLTLNDPKLNDSYPDNLYRTIPSNNALSSDIVKKALERIYEGIKTKKTLFWGAGIYGSKILYYLRKTFGEIALDNVTGFIDSLKDRQDTSILGLRVFAPNDPTLHTADLILITSYSYEPEILRSAQQLGLRNITVALHQEWLVPLGIKSGIF
ncbi:MAG: hypothetical protein FIA97_04310 [Methylococcaceae bacterium]|nr:hypothetical protein [Methylococcaceae bacterium]